MKLPEGIRIHRRAITGLGGALFLLAAITAGAGNFFFEDEISVHGPLPAVQPADPVRAMEISERMAEREALTADARARIQDLNARHTASADRTERIQLATEIRDEKMALERRNMELGLEIATLRGRDEQAARFAAALEEVTR